MPVYTEEMTKEKLEKILELADNPETLRNPKGIYFTVTEPSDVLMDVFKEEGINLLNIRREATFFVPNEVLEKFRKEVE